MGIGYGIVYRLAEAGATTVIADMNEAAAQSAAANLTAKGWKALSYACDISDTAQIERLVKQVVESCGSIDILVNNAGIYPTTLVMDLEESYFDKIMSINLKGTIFMTKTVATQMIAQGKGGKIVNITSIDALHPSSVGLAIYDASKHGLWGFTKNLALELAPHKIWVNAVAPGGITTPGSGAGKPMSEEMKKISEAFTAKIPMKRMGEPDDIGKAVLFLASDLSSYMTGSQLIVDGGVLLS